EPAVTRGGVVFAERGVELSQSFWRVVTLAGRRRGGTLEIRRAFGRRRRNGCLLRASRASWAGRRLRRARCARLGVRTRSFWRRHRRSAAARQYHQERARA